MRFLTLFAPLFFAGVLILAAWAMRVAQSPPAAYAAAVLGIAAGGGLVVSLIIIWLTGR